MTLPRTQGLHRLPYELIVYIVGDLDIEDVFHWSLCSKHFQYIIREDRFCKPVVMTKAPNTLEAREALETGQFSRALRRLVKRRNALSQASPYVLGIVACADSYEFSGGKLCYIVEARPQRWLRILDIHKSTDWELVVNIPLLIRMTIPQAAKSRKYKFRVLHHEAGIVTCLFSFALPRTENWLFIMKPQEQRVLETCRVESTSRLFVRNNERFLYFGTHSGEGADGLRKWVLKGFDLDKQAWLPHPRMYLPHVAGCDMGSTVCFEIIGGYFYGLSNQTLFEVDDPHWTSHYYCFRFPLHEPCTQEIQVMKKEYSWRRQHSEGPIDDRWGFLSLETDDTTGSIVILECRKEWLKDQSGSRRTYYTTEVVFDQETGQTDQERVRNGTMTRRLADRPQSDIPIPLRSPHHTHPGDDSSVSSLMMRSKTHFCAYIRCCQTFIDLIDDSCTDTSDMPRLRLRTGHRRLKASASHAPMQFTRHVPTTLASSNTPPLDFNEPSQEPAMQPYQANDIYIWPAGHHSSDQDPSLDRVQQLLKIDGNPACVTATGDERSIIYATGDGSNGGLKALVFLSFDPATRFEHMEYGGDLLGQRDSLDAREAADGRVNSDDATLQFGPMVPLGARDKVATCNNNNNNDTHGKTSLSSSGSTALASSSTDYFPPPPPLLPTPTEGVEPWASYERPMHLEIQRKLYFSR